jgi:hypothetical protein
MEQELITASDAAELEEERTRLQQLQLVRYMIEKPNASVTQICEACGIGRTTFYRWKKELVRLLRDLAPSQEVISLIQFQAREAIPAALKNVIEIATGERKGARSSDQVKAFHELVMIAGLTVEPGEENSDDASDFLHKIGKGGNVYIQTLNVNQLPPGDVIDGEVIES